MEIDDSLFEPENESKFSMTNFDYSIHPNMEEDLKAGKWSHHAANEFYALIRWNGTQFVSYVKQYGSVIDCIEADTLKELMIITNLKHAPIQADGITQLLDLMRKAINRAEIVKLKCNNGIIDTEE